MIERRLALVAAACLLATPAFAGDATHFLICRSDGCIDIPSLRFVPKTPRQPAPNPALPAAPGAPPPPTRCPLARDRSRHHGILRQPSRQKVLRQAGVLATATPGPATLGLGH